MKKSKKSVDTLKSQLSSNIKLFRVNSGLSQEDLAEKAGISLPYMGAIERGEKWPSSTILGKIADSLNMEPHDLLRPENVTVKEVRNVTEKLAKDMAALLNESVKMLNNIAKENS